MESEFAARFITIFSGLLDAEFCCPENSLLLGSKPVSYWMEEIRNATHPDFLNLISRNKPPTFPELSALPWKNTFASGLYINLLAPKPEGQVRFNFLHIGVASDPIQGLWRSLVRPETSSFWLSQSSTSRGVDFSKPIESYFDIHIISPLVFIKQENPTEEYLLEKQLTLVLAQAVYSVWLGAFSPSLITTKLHDLIPYRANASLLEWRGTASHSSLLEPVSLPVVHTVENTTNANQNDSLIESGNVERNETAVRAAKSSVPERNKKTISSSRLKRKALIALLPDSDREKVETADRECARSARIKRIKPEPGIPQKRSSRVAYSMKDIVEMLPDLYRRFGKMKFEDIQKETPKPIAMRQNPFQMPPSHLITTFFKTPDQQAPAADDHPSDAYKTTTTNHQEAEHDTDDREEPNSGVESDAYIPSDQGRTEVITNSGSPATSNFPRVKMEDDEQISELYAYPAWHGTAPFPKTEPDPDSAQRNHEVYHRILQNQALLSTLILQSACQRRTGR